MIEPRERERLRSLAGRWMAQASRPVMAERRRAWTALKDLHAERPMVLFETWTLLDYVTDNELVCADPELRRLERQMLWHVRHAEEVGDDIVVEPFYRVYWHIEASSYGVDLQAEHGIDLEGGNVGYTFDYPIRTPDDIDRLIPRTWQVDRPRTERRVELLQDLFGDILPVVLHGTGAFWSGLTQDLYKMIGNDRLLLWTYDAPDALHRLMAYIRDDRLAYFDWLEREGLLGLNSTGWELVGSGSPGYTTALPVANGADGPVKLADLWVWMESQETTMISPRMFGDFFLPYMADVCRRFGLVYYGCCEPVHDRWDRIRAEIPNVRAVSISPWCDQRWMAEKLGRSCVFSRKPRPAPISGESPDWDALSADIAVTLDAARDCNLEIVYRDVYRICGDRPRLRRWADMVRAKMS
ncbi:MAG: hypothetical protein BWY52_00230 [Chloroflexi bacterium ADurb.Bin325]|nr:MAG: hypothetical protein BWY52_00230 [Chloroflexi bacterium ADurb.Bin325]